MVAGNLKSATPRRGRAGDHVYPWPIVAQEVHVDGDQGLYLVAQVAGQIESLHKDFGQYHGRAEIQIDSVRQAGHDFGETVEVPQAGLTNGGTIGAGVHVNDVGADGHVYGDRDVEAGTGRQDTQFAVGVATSGDVTPQGLAEPQIFLRSLSDDPIEYGPSLLGHAEAPLVEPRAHIFGSFAGRGEFEVVDDARPVERDRSEDPPLHEVDDHGRESDLDRVGAHSQGDTAPASACLGDGAGDIA